MHEGALNPYDDLKDMLDHGLVQLVLRLPRFIPLSKQPPSN